MPQLPSTITARPTVTVDARAGRVVEPALPDPTYPGTPGPFGRARVVTALPTNGDGPVLVSLPVMLRSPRAYVVDADGNFVGGGSALYIHRLVTARWVEDTRRLGG
jgi:hypothetical protein